MWMLLDPRLGELAALKKWFEHKATSWIPGGLLFKTPCLTIFFHIFYEFEIEILHPADGDKPKWTWDIQISTFSEGVCLGAQNNATFPIKIKTVSFFLFYQVAIFLLLGCWLRFCRINIIQGRSFAQLLEICNSLHICAGPGKWVCFTRSCQVFFPFVGLLEYEWR